MSINTSKGLLWTCVIRDLLRHRLKAIQSMFCTKKCPESMLFSYLYSYRREGPPELISSDNTMHE